MKMQIQTTGELIEACLVISEEHYNELVKAFGARLRNLIIEAENIATKHGTTYEEANQAYWTSYETKDALSSSLLHALDAVTKCRSARDSLLRVIQASE